MLELLLCFGGRLPAKHGSYSTQMHTLSPCIKSITTQNDGVKALVGMKN